MPCTEPPGRTRSPPSCTSRPDREKKLGRKGAFLADLIEWRFETLPDMEPKKAFDKTLLILWGRYRAWRPRSPGLALRHTPWWATGGFGFNEFTGDSLSLPQMRQAIADGLPPGKRIDILSFDSCFMSAAEVSAEFQRECPQGARDPKAGKGQDDAAGVDFVVASQSAVLLDGLEYGRARRRLHRQGSPSASSQPKTWDAVCWSRPARRRTRR